MSLLAEAWSRASDLYKNAPTSKSVAQLSFSSFDVIASLSISFSYLSDTSKKSKPMLSGKFFPEIICHLFIWSSKTFIIILVSLEFCIDAQKYSEDFCPPQRVDTLESVPYRNVENCNIFHPRVIHVIWRRWFGAQLECCLWDLSFIFLGL